MTAAGVSSAAASAAASIHANLWRLQEEIGCAARRSALRSDDVKLIAVSKTRPWPAVEAAIQAGQCHFGENRLQDAMTKIPFSRDRGVEWHFIGHLQSNKAHSVPRNFSWVHSVDGLHLAQKLSAAAAASAHTINVLVQINLTREEQKSGVLPEDLPALMARFLETPLPGLNFRGLMAMGPRDGDERSLRKAFAGLRLLRDETAKRTGLPQFTELSMGMSGDYLYAIMEGATLVRIGTAVFGARPPVR